MLLKHASKHLLGFKGKRPYAGQAVAQVPGAAEECLQSFQGPRLIKRDLLVG